MKLTEMRNIGKEMANKLHSIGITTPEELQLAGSKEAFLQLRLTHENVCLVHLYALHGAIENLDYNQLPEKTKQELKSFSDQLK